MKKLMSNVLADITGISLIGAFTFTCVGACIWSVKWVLNLLGVM